MRYKTLPLPLIAILMFALGVPLTAQSPAFHATNFADNTVWCATNNCLTSVGGNYAEIKAGVDGTVYGRTTSNLLYTYTPSNGWVEAASALQTAGGYSLAHISVGSVAQVLALSSAPSGNNVFVLDSAGTAWTALSQRLTAAEIGADGSIWGMDSAAQIWSYVSGVWTDPPGQLSNIANPGFGAVWGINSSGTLLQWNGTAFVAFSPAPSFTPSQAQNAIASVDGTEVAVVDTAGTIHIFDALGSGPALQTAISTKNCNSDNAPTCVDTVASTAGFQMGDEITETGNSLSNGTWFVQSLTATSVTFQSNNTGTGGAGGTLTDNSTQNSNAGQWHALQGSAVAVTGGRNMAFALNSTGGAYHLNLVVPQAVDALEANDPCDKRTGCSKTEYWARVSVHFGGIGGAHGTAGVTSSYYVVQPTHGYASVEEQGSNCDPFIDPNAPECGWDYTDSWPNIDQEDDYAGTFGVLQTGAGYTLVENLSSPAGFGCYSNFGVTMCSYLVAPSCTNTPQWAPQIVDDGPPAEAGWYSYYVCVRGNSSQPWTCEPIPTQAHKTTDTGPVNCPFYVITVPIT